MRWSGAGGAGVLAWCGGVLLGGAAQGEEKPLWELGLGVGTVSLPLYRGADERRDFVLPMPYVIYRGEVLKADRRGVRGELIERGGLELDLAAGASPPVGSGRVAVRRGMPDLRATLGLGPSLDYLAWQSADTRRQLRLQLPTLASFTVESSPRFVGWQGTPRVNLDLDGPFGAAGWKLGLRAGLVYATRRQHGYFYRVGPAQATADRPAFDAPGGYAGREVLMSWSKRFPAFWVGAFLRHDQLAGAAFADSPLVRRTDYRAGGIAFAWIIDEAAQRVPAED